MNSLPRGDGETDSPPLRPPPFSLPKYALEPGEASSPYSPARTRSPAPSPARKRMKLDLSGLSPPSRKKRLSEHRLSRLRHVATACREDMAEMYFLTTSTNVIDLPVFRKKPSQAFVGFLKGQDAPPRVISEVDTAVLGSAVPPPEVRRHVYSPRVVGLLSPVKVGHLQDVYSARVQPILSRPAPTIPPPTAPAYSIQQVQEKIKQEGWVLRRVNELTRDGLWPAKRLPKVVEAPRPVAAWDLVLEEMKWMAADFKQERIWKKSAARVSAAAVKEAVADRNARKASEAALLENSLAQRTVARSLAEQVSHFWGNVARLYEYELARKSTIFNTRLISCQLNHVSEIQESLNPPRKRRHDEISSGRSSPDYHEGENGNVTSDDDDSTIEEQEAFELLNSVNENELCELRLDAETEICALLRDNYPGVLTEYNDFHDLDDYLDVSDEEDDDIDLAHADSHKMLSLSGLMGDHDGVQPPVTANGDLNTKDLNQLSAKAETLMPKSVINNSGGAVCPTLVTGRLRDYQLVGIDWLRRMYSERLPAILADDQGLGRRVIAAAFISYLVVEAASPGPHIILAPASSLQRWQKILSVWCPGLRTQVCTGSVSDSVQLRLQLSDCAALPNLVLTSYRAFYRDSEWFIRRSWGVVFMAEVQNVVAAGSPDQILALCELRSDHRALIMTGPHKENPIDLWNLVYLLFPATYELHSESVVKGTAEYKETVSKLQKTLSSFTLSRTRANHPTIDKQLPTVNQIPTFVGLSNRQRKMYDDFLAKPDTQDELKNGDLSAVCTVMSQLRNICNHPSLVNSSPSPALPSPPLPTWCRLNPRPERLVEKMVSTSPLDSVNFENMNLVFLKQELTTTVLTSARLRSIKASRELIHELATSDKHPAPLVPTRKVTFALEGITRTANGWNIPGGWVEGMGLVRAATGQVFKVCSNPLKKGERGTAGALTRVVRLQPEILKSIAEINHWRCSGFPLYGQDLIQSLEVTSSVRPARSRFCGQGYINCLTAPLGTDRLEPDDWRYTTRALEPMVNVGRLEVRRLKETLDNFVKLTMDPRSLSPKFQALDRILEERSRRREKVILFTSTTEVLHLLQQFCALRSYRYLVVSGEMSYADDISALERFRLEPRAFLLILAGVQTFAGLDLPQVKTVVEFDWSPSHVNLCNNILGWSPNTIFRLICRGSMEESLGRRPLQRRIISDLEAAISQNTLKKQTIEEIFNPSSTDNGYLWTEKKKKEKVKDEMEEKLMISQVFSILGVPGGNQPSCLLDLAEFDTMDMEVEDLEGNAEIRSEAGAMDTRLMAWLETVPPIQRYGMKQMFDWPELFSEKQWLQDQPIDNDKLKLNLEKDICRRAAKRRRETETLEYVTYPSHLAGREWCDDQGELPIYNPPGYFEEMEDLCTGLLYNTEEMKDEDLPPVYIKKEKKRDNLVGGSISQSAVPSPASSSTPLSPADKPKIKREESITTAPKSIFDRPKPFKTIARPRPGGVLNPVTFGSQTLTNQLSSTKTVIREGDSGPEWSIQEDWALHQAIISLQEMPLSLSANSPAHVSNWDMVSDIVNAVSRCFRSPRQCRNRYETTILPREEGKILYNDITPTKKPKKTKLNLKQPEKKPSISKPMKTSVLFKQDNNNAWSSQFASRFETIKAIANKRTPTTKPLLVSSTQRNPKHASVLADFSVSYDTPLSPVQVAANRAERILRDKQRTQQAAAAQAQLAAQQPVAVSSQQQQTIQQVRVSVASASIPVASAIQANPAQAVVVGISQPVQQQQGQLVASASQITNTSRSVANHAIVTVSGVLSGLQTTSTLTRLAGGQIIVSQAGKSAVPGAQTTLQAACRSLTPAQLMVLKTQAVLKRKEQMRARQVLQNNSLVVSSGGIVSTVATAVTTARTIGSTAQGIGRGQIVRPTNVTNVRSMTEPELKAMLAKQQLKVTGPGMVHVQPGASLSTAQLQQLGIQVATPPGSTAQLVKAGVASTSTGKSVTIPLAGVNLQSLQGGQLKTVAGRGTVFTGTQSNTQIQHLRQLMMRGKGGVQQKVALQQVGGKLPTQLIVQGQQGKALPATVTVQQLQEIVKSVAGSGQGQVQIGTVAGTGQQILSHAVFSKAGMGGGQTVQARVIPVSGTAGRGQQTIQVVAAGPAVQRRTVPNVTLDALSRQQGGAASALASALAAGNHVKIAAPGGATQQQILSQVTAALAGQTGQPVSVAVRTPASSSTVSYQTGLIPHTVKAVVSQQQQQLVNNVQQQQVINSNQSQHIISSQQLGVLQQQLVNSQPLGSTQQQQIVTSNPQLVSLQLNSVQGSGNSGQTNQSTEPS